MKRFLCVLLVALALVGLMTTVASAEEYAMVTSENGYGVRMREGPSKAYRVVTKYDVGTTVIVQQRGTEWSQIRVGETVGWMMNEFLIFADEEPEEPQEPITTATVNADSLWLREYGSSTAPTKAKLFRGDTVDVLEIGGTWCKVSFRGLVGYSMTEFLDF